ncbi:hypothetical protein NEDG_01228 [Nematocida displodere]|uniref:Uncharacterized protein n=1 Tax=Nematocida displodere TaxID=1805483 RepID=A0A177EDL9_9MICR|nr:hypothetical protein NEDG_01228 [Nematocida displodere]
MERKWGGKLRKEHMFHIVSLVVLLSLCAYNIFQLVKRNKEAPVELSGLFKAGYISKFNEGLWARRVVDSEGLGCINIPESAEVLVPSASLDLKKAMAGMLKNKISNPFLFGFADNTTSLATSLDRIFKLKISHNAIVFTNRVINTYAASFFSGEMKPTEYQAFVDVIAELLIKSENGYPNRSTNTPATSPARTTQTAPPPPTIMSMLYSDYVLLGSFIGEYATIFLGHRIPFEVFAESFNLTKEERASKTIQNLIGNIEITPEPNRVVVG